MKNSPHIIFMITERCNCNCFFCSRNNLHKTVIEPSLNQLYKAFDILHQEYPLSKLILSGGEPTLSKYFKDIVEYTTESFRKVEIQSNGTLTPSIVKYILPYMRTNLHLQVSLDGTAELHNQIRGKNVFEQAVDVIQTLDEVHDHVTISMTITPENLKNALKLAYELNNIKFRKLKVSIVQPLNPRLDKLITNDEWNEFVDMLLPLCYYHVDISKLFDFGMMDEFLSSGKPWNGTANCGRGITHIYIQSNFDVLPCTCIPYSVGNLLKDNITKIRKGLKACSSILLSEKSVCSACKYKCVCNGGCPGLSTKIFGVPNMGDIRCPKVKKQAIDMGLINE